MDALGGLMWGGGRRLGELNGFAVKSFADGPIAIHRFHVFFSRRTGSFASRDIIMPSPVHLPQPDCVQIAARM
jgi:hypothetical protein